MSLRHTHLLGLFVLLFAATAQGQICAYHLPYNQNFNTGFALDNGWVNTNLDTTLVFRENCWKQYNYRAIGRWPMVSYLPHEQNYQLALRLIARHLGEDQSRVERTDMYTPPFLDAPSVISFDYCNRIASQELDSEGLNIDVTAERTGILQIGYVSDTSQPESSYNYIRNIVMDPANGATDSMRHLRLDLRTCNVSLTSVKQIVFKVMTDMTGVHYTNIYIDNFHIGYEMDTITYRDTVCLGEPYVGHGFTVDSTETLTPGVHTFQYEVMESYGMACHRLLLYVSEPVTVHIDTTIAYGDALRFRDTLITDRGDYVFNLTTSLGCDSTVVLHVGYMAVTLVASTQKVCLGDEVVLTVSGASAFLWNSIPLDPSLEARQGQARVVVHPVENTIYQVLDTDAKLFASVNVEVEICEGFWIPNIFTPDFETNNLFGIYTTMPVEFFEMTIYDRAGLKVWHCEDIHQWWDGTSRGVPLPQGAYTYIWRMKSRNRIRTGTGTVTLLR